MNDVYAVCGNVTRIAYQGENNRTRVHFDLSDLMEEFPGGSAVLTLRRHGDTDAVPSESTEMSGTELIWTVTAWECEKRHVYGQIVYSVCTVVAKTKVYRFDVAESLTATNTEPDDWADWVDELVEAAADTKAAVESYDEMTAAATGLPAGSTPTAQIDRTGDHPVLRLGLVAGEDSVAITVYPVQAIACDYNRHAKVDATYKIAFRAKRGDDQIGATCLAGYDKDNPHHYHGMYWWMSKACTASQEGQISIKVIHGTDPLDPFDYDSMVCPVTFTLDDGSTFRQTVTLFCPRDGYTPVRGTDYWTAEDQAAMRQDIAEDVAAARQAITEEKNSAVAAVGAAGTTQVGLVTGEGTTQKAAVVAKGQETLASIPSDYTTLSNDVSDLKSAVNEKILTESRNLLNVKFILEKRIDGSTGDIANANNANAAAEEYISVEASTKYTVSVADDVGNMDFYLYISQYNSSKTFISQPYAYIKSSQKTGTITTNENAAYVRFSVYRYASSAISLRMQFEKGETATEYIQPVVIDITETDKATAKTFLGFLTSSDITGKADKVTSATEGNFAGLDSNGNLTDSGHKHSDYLTSHQDITGKADKVSSATSGNFAGLDSNGNLTDSGHKHSDYLTSHQDISGKADKVSGGTANNFAGIDSNGNLKDSGYKAGDFLTSHQSLAGKADKVSYPTSGNFASLDSTGNIADSGHSHSDYTALIGAKVNKPSGNGTSGQVLRTNGDGTTDWASIGLPTDAQTAEAVSDWLDDHPDATTTVQDHSLTYQKLVNGTLNFVMPEMFGAVGDGETDDTEAIKDAIETGLPVVFGTGKTYATTSVIDMTTDAYLFGYGATILATENAHDMFIFRDGDIHVYGLTLIGNRSDFPSTAKSGLVLYEGCRTFISDVTIKEFSCHGLIVTGGFALVTNVVIKNIGFAGGFSFIYASGSPKTFFANILCENPEYLGEGYGIQAFYLNDGSHTITNFQTINAHIPFDCRSGNAVVRGGYCKNTAGIGVTVSSGQTTGVNLVASDVLFENVHKLSNSSNAIIQIANCEHVSISNCTFIIGSEAEDGSIEYLMRFYGDYGRKIGPVFIDNVKIIGDKKVNNGLLGSGMTNVSDILITNCQFPVLNNGNSFLMQLNGTNTANITLINTVFKGKTNRMYCYDNTSHDAYPYFTFIPTYRTRGTTNQRPTVVGDTAGVYYDTTLGKLIMWNGSAWKNLDGTSL